jgi:hypothetical protein
MASLFKIVDYWFDDTVCLNNRRLQMTLMTGILIVAINFVITETYAFPSVKSLTKNIKTNAKKMEISSSKIETTNSITKRVIPICEQEQLNSCENIVDEEIFEKILKEQTDKSEIIKIETINMINHKIKLSDIQKAASKNNNQEMEKINNWISTTATNNYEKMANGFSSYTNIAGTKNKWDMKKNKSNNEIYAQNTNKLKDVNQSNCPNDLSYLRGRVNTKELIPERFPTVDEAVKEAGGLDRAIILTRLQIEGNESALSELSKNFTLKKSSPAFYNQAVNAINDVLILNRAYLQAFECRKK